MSNRKQFEIARQLARMFCRLLTEELTPEQLEEVNARNAKEADANICHSHDFTDPNVLMLAAFNATDGAKLDANGMPDPAQWAEAWSLAKRAEFFDDAVEEWGA